MIPNRMSIKRGHFALNDYSAQSCFNGPVIQINHDPRGRIRSIAFRVEQPVNIAPIPGLAFTPISSGGDNVTQ
jgi:hypothetical protein